MKSTKNSDFDLDLFISGSHLAEMNWKHLKPCICFCSYNILKVMGVSCILVCSINFEKMSVVASFDKNVHYTLTIRWRKTCVSLNQLMTWSRFITNPTTISRTSPRSLPGVVLGSNPSQLAAGDAAVVRLKPLSTPLCVEAFEVRTALQVAVGVSIPIICYNHKLY